MKNVYWMASAVLLAGVASCGDAPAPAAEVAAEVEITEIAPEDLPADVRALAESAAEGFIVSEVLRKVRDGRTYYDVEGGLPDGSEIEFDILMTDAGPEIVEIQRDLDWANVPEAVRAAADAAAQGMSPARVIESTQTDGVIIYELFAPGAPVDPAMEVSLSPQGDVSVLTERWPH
ncbi:hypothetical protein [Hyphomonas sp.]|uniref:hypothetical protein n=1 Tax=Hyphomonas sp. TaxID=87 RepID=UPI0039188218